MDTILRATSLLLAITLLWVAPGCAGADVDVSAAEVGTVCAIDVDCPANEWCDETRFRCAAKLANGQAMPVDPAHVNPTLNGTCTAQAGALVCSSGVCSVSDNRCGYVNAGGPCTVANGSTVCRSGVCDPDGRCGYANGDGPCNASNAGTVCRSGTCSANALCMPAGGCNVDADCAGASWCNESSHTCFGRLPNGASIPADPPHSSPTLNGTCTTAAASLVCASGACDTTDNRCGYANGDGPCTPANAMTVCRSSMCSVNGRCEPIAGCNVDADCMSAQWCNEQNNVCTNQLSNGAPIPTDPVHTTPTLDGTCTTAAATLVCVSGVCDATDDECGYATAHGPCNASNGATVCRTGACSANGLCMAIGGCNVDADCTSGQWCDEQSSTCSATLANGSPIPMDPAHTSPTLDGRCSASAAALVCTSGVCDTTDDRCGYPVGGGPCDATSATTVCRSSACSAQGTCMPIGGCNVDADCTMPAQSLCDAASHQCVGRDAGPPDVGPIDAGTDAATIDAATIDAATLLDAAARDAGVDASTDASRRADGSSVDTSMVDSGASPPAPSPACGCRTSRSTSRLGWVALALVIAARRRRRAR